MTHTAETAWMWDKFHYINLKMINLIETQSYTSCSYSCIELFSVIWLVNSNRGMSPPYVTILLRTPDPLISWLLISSIASDEQHILGYYRKQCRQTVYSLRLSESRRQHLIPAEVFRGGLWPSNRGKALRHWWTLHYNFRERGLWSDRFLPSWIQYTEIILKAEVETATWSSQDLVPS